VPMPYAVCQTTPFKKRSPSSETFEPSSPPPTTRLLPQARGAGSLSVVQSANGRSPGCATAHRDRRQIGVEDLLRTFDPGSKQVAWHPTTRCCYPSSHRVPLRPTPPARGQRRPDLVAPEHEHLLPGSKSAEPLGCHRIPALVLPIFCWLAGTSCSSEHAAPSDTRAPDTAVVDAGPFDLPPGCDAFLHVHYPNHPSCVGTVGCVELPIRLCDCVCSLCENGSCVMVTCDDSCMFEECRPDVLGTVCSATSPCPSSLYDCIGPSDGGFCACSCTPDDPSTPLVVEDTCPDQARFTCRSYTADAGTNFYCVETSQ